METVIDRLDSFRVYNQQGLAGLVRPARSDVKPCSRVSLFELNLLLLSAAVSSQPRSHLRLKPLACNRVDVCRGPANPPNQKSFQTKLQRKVVSVHLPLPPLRVAIKRPPGDSTLLPGRRFQTACRTPTGLAWNDDAFAPSAGARPIHSQELTLSTRRSTP